MLVVQKSEHTIVQDRSIFEGVYVFVRNNYERGDLSQRDYETFMELFDLMKSQMKMPDMMIYLRKSVPALIAQIQKRGRDYEQTMQIDYLKDLNEPSCSGYLVNKTITGINNTLTPLNRHRGSPTGANVVHPVGRAEASVARLFSGAV